MPTLCCPTDGTKQAGRNLWDADTWGVLCSVGCAIHCALTPVLLSSLSVAGSWSGLADPWVHQVAAVACLLLAVWAFLPAYRIHRNSAIPLIAGIGLLCLIAGAWLPANCCDIDAPMIAATFTTAAPAGQESLLVNDSLGNIPTLSLQTASDSQPAWQPNAILAAMGIIPWLTPLGGALLIIAHLWNTQARRMISR